MPTFGKRRGARCASFTAPTSTSPPTTGRHSLLRLGWRRWIALGELTLGGRARAFARAPETSRASWTRPDARGRPRHPLGRPDCLRAGGRVRGRAGRDGRVGERAAPLHRDPRQPRPVHAGGPPHPPVRAELRPPPRLRPARRRGRGGLPVRAAAGRPRRGHRPPVGARAVLSRAVVTGSWAGGSGTPLARAGPATRSSRAARCWWWCTTLRSERSGSPIGCCTASWTRRRSWRCSRGTALRSAPRAHPPALPLPGHRAPAAHLRRRLVHRGWTRGLLDHRDRRRPHRTLREARPPGELTHAGAASAGTALARLAAASAQG